MLYSCTSLNCEELRDQDRLSGTFSVKTNKPAGLREGAIGWRLVSRCRWTRAAKDTANVQKCPEQF